MSDARLIDVCSLCGAAVEQDDDGPCCPDAKIVQVEAISAVDLLGTDRPRVLGTLADLKRLGLVAEDATELPAWRVA